MAVTITETPYRLQNVGFGTKNKVVFVADTTATLKSTMGEIIDVQVTDIQAESAPAITVSGGDVTLTYSVAKTTTLYVDVLGR